MTGVHRRGGPPSCELARHLGVEFDNAEFLAANVFVFMIKCWLAFGTAAGTVNRRPKTRENVLLWFASLRMGDSSHDCGSIH